MEENFARCRRLGYVQTGREPYQERTIVHINKALDVPPGPPSEAEYVRATTQPAHVAVRVTISCNSYDCCS
ncbi:MAG TPA: hypothetical protein VFX76_18055, partial [Roseiflexaceae bacterium]|nr:hypothetical protein [Roseiflexaceae bacterium]